MYKTVGKYIPESRDQPEVIEREYYGQGMIYKNWEAYYDTAHPDRVCYIPELSDSLYTRQASQRLQIRFLRMLTGNLQKLYWRNSGTKNWLFVLSVKNGIGVTAWTNARIVGMKRR